MGELSKLLMGREPAKALRLARDTGVLAELLPEFEPAIGFDQESRWHDLSVDEHTFAVVQAASDLGFPLRVRLAALFHDIGKPQVAWRGDDGRLHFYARAGKAVEGHEEVSAALAARALRRLRYPNALRAQVTRIVRRHMLSIGKGDALRARRLLARNGEQLTFDLIDHKEADLRGKRADALPVDELEALAEFRRVVQRELANPHRLGDLAIDGSDLIAAGFREGPAIGRTLDRLLREVVGDPTLNRRDWLLERAAELRE
jgi:tRNA nucleotidyltransferase (CCA-adding enzyme)